MKTNENARKVSQGDSLTELNSPIIFELGAVSGLLFKDDGIHHLLENDMLQIAEVKTVDDKRANIIIGLTIIMEEYFELKFVLTTTRGIERMSIYDQVGNLNAFQLKKWMHTVLCDEMRKTTLITKFPEYYSFDDTLFLA